MMSLFLLMVKPLKNPIKNPLRISYERFWVPIFGRALRLFSGLIEGEEPKEKQTYKLNLDDDYE